MKGLTNEYYQNFLEAKSSFIESDVIKELDGDYSNYKFMYQKISELLHDPSGIEIDSCYTRKQLIIESKLNPKMSEYVNYSLNIFNIIRDAVQEKVHRFNQKIKWVKAIHLAILYHTHRESNVEHHNPQEYEIIANSFFYLKKEGFNIESVDGYLKINDPEFERLSLAIESRVKKLGRHGFDIFTSHIGNHFSKEHQRFFFYRKRPTMPTNQIPLPPNGYAFNLFCKYLNLHNKLKTHQKRKLIGEVQNLSTHIATILDIDKMSPWANINTSQENILDKITEWVLYPEVFYIPQISIKHGRKMFPRIFELIKSNDSTAKNEIITAAKVMERIEDSILQRNGISGEFTEYDIQRLCFDIDNNKNINGVLESISQHADNINNGFITPFDAEKTNIHEFPLIKTSNGYLVTNVATYNAAKYRALFKISKKHNLKTEQQLGYALEDFIKENFDDSNITYHHSFKYSAPDYIRNITKTNRRDGECDFIIESEKYLYLIEVKKKGLTKESKSGNGVKLLVDISLSFLKSINQLTIAEIILLNEGEICHSKNNQKISLNERTIFKIVISLEDMASLQCDNIKSSLLRGLYNIKININDENYKGDEDNVNDTIDEFTCLHNELFTKGEMYQNNPFHCISYLSTPQLLTILSDVSNNEDFSHNITRSNGIVYNLMDWYASYKAAKKNNLLNNNQEILSKSTLIAN